MYEDTTVEWGEALHECCRDLARCRFDFTVSIIEEGAEKKQ